jgi:OOP family OmpA-OmpF porin
MTILSRIMATGLFVAVAGCGLGGTFDAEPYTKEKLSDTKDFSACLAREYQERAKLESTVDKNWTDTGRIVRKGRAAQANQTPLPWEPTQLGVLPEDLEELVPARARLMAALDGNGRQTRPCECAAAQRHYDGWVEQASDDDFSEKNGYFFGGPGGPIQPKRAAAEKIDFFERLMACEGVPAAAPKMDKPMDFTVYFGWDRYDLTPEAMALVDEIVNYTRDFKSPWVGVSGYADTSGSSDYNVGLSQRRANTVANALSKRGINDVQTKAFGETNLAVATGDGVKEPLNRRATVVVKEK